MSGLPKPRSMTSSPARRASAFRPSMMLRTYGGSPVMRRNSIAPRVTEALARSRPFGHRPPRSEGAHLGGRLGHHLEGAGPGAHGPRGPRLGQFAQTLGERSDSARERAGPRRF